MDLQAMADRAAEHDRRGEYRQAADIYEKLLEWAQGPGGNNPQIVRSLAFNLAQFLNKLGDYDRALELTELGLALSPSAVGRAIGQAARGEALCGLKRIDEGKAAFREAAEGHPIIGRLNSADSMTRVGGGELLDMAEEWVTTVVNDYGSQLNKDLQDEVDTIRREVLNKRTQIQ